MKLALIIPPIYIVFQKVQKWEEDIGWINENNLK